MQLLAIERSKERLRRARNSIASYNRATNFDEAHDAWTNFLVAASGIYAKLEQGSKGNNKSTDWFNKKKNERKNDPMRNTFTKQGMQTSMAAFHVLRATIWLKASTRR